jgi:hypothetical protein
VVTPSPSLPAPAVPACEGLGPLAERAFLDGTVGSWRANLATHLRTDAAGLDAVLAPSILASTVALDDARRLGGRVESRWGMATTLAALTGTPLVIDGATAGTGGGPPPPVTPSPETACRELPPRARALPGVRIPGTDVQVEVADAWVLPVGHAVQLLWANLLALGPFLWGRLVGSGPLAVLRLAGGALRAGSLQPEDVAARLNVLGAGARVHRTATVEGCVLGRNARVGAGAVVRGCVLGDDAVVEELALVEGSVLGAGARIQRMALCKFSVIEAGAAHAGIVQLGIVGAGAQVKHGATLMDMALGGAAVRVRVGTELRDAPFGLCGVIVGPGAVVGSGVRVAPGRILPPGVEIIADPDSVLRTVALAPGVRRAHVRAGRAHALDTAPDDGPGGGVAEGTPPRLAASAASSGARGEDASAAGGAAPGAASTGPRPRRPPSKGDREGAGALSAPNSGERT